jgi:hypothetical protein
MSQPIASPRVHYAFLPARRGVTVECCPIASSKQSEVHFRNDPCTSRVRDTEKPSWGKLAACPTTEPTGATVAWFSPPCANHHLGLSSCVKCVGGVAGALRFAEAPVISLGSFAETLASRFLRPDTLTLSRNPRPKGTSLPRLPSRINQRSGASEKRSAPGTRRGSIQSH